MTKDETAQILMLLINQYPQSFTHLKSASDTDMFIDVWYSGLKNISYDLVKQAVINIITTDTNQFAPNLANVIENTKMFQSKNDLDIENEAYIECDKLFSFARNINDNAERVKREFDKLGLITRKLFDNNKWQAVRYVEDLNQDNKNYVRKDFVSRYIKNAKADRDEYFNQYLENSSLKSIEEPKEY